MASASFVLGDPCYGLTSDQCASVNGGAPASDSGGAAGWLSGLGNLFTGIGNAVVSGMRTANAPAGSGPYYTATGVNTSAPQPASGTTMILVVVVALGAILLLRRK